MSRHNITGSNQTAFDADVLSIRECFSHRGSADARLRCVSRIHGNQLPTSVLSFVGDFCNEGSPASIVNRLGQHSSRQPFDVQVFDNDCAEVSNEPEGLPMLILISQSPDSSMNLLKQSNCCTSPITAFLTPSGTPLCSPKSCLSLLIPTRMGNLRAVGQRSERRKTYVDTDGVIQSRKQFPPAPPMCCCTTTWARSMARSAPGASRAAAWAASARRSPRRRWKRVRRSAPAPRSPIS